MKWRRMFLRVLTTATAVLIAMMFVPHHAWCKDRIKVGLPISLSGKYDVLGQRNLEGARLWVEWVNKNGGIEVKDLKKNLPVEVVWYDTKSDKDTTIKLTEKLISEDKVDFLLGPYGSSLTFAAAAISEKYGKLMFSHSGASDKIWKQGFKYVIGVLTPSSYYYKSTMELLKTVDPPVKSIALITEDNPFNLSIRAGIKRWAKELGFDVVFDEVYPSPPSDLSPILSKVKRLNPDAILAASHFKDGALLARQAAELKVTPKFFALGSAPSTLEWWKAVGRQGARCTVATSQWEPIDAPKADMFKDWFGPRLTALQFNAVYKKRWGKPTDFRGAQAFASGIVLQWGIQNAGSLDTDKIRTALNKMDIMTFYGRQKIDPKTGIQVGHGMIIAQWQDGKKVVVGPPGLEEGKLVYPIPK